MKIKLEVEMEIRQDDDPENCLRELHDIQTMVAAVHKKYADFLDHVAETNLGRVAKMSEEHQP